MSEEIFTLEKNELLALESGRAVEVRIRRGQVWLTQHMDGSDYVLEAGAILPLNGKGTTLVKAYRPAVVEVRRAAPALLPLLRERRDRLMPALRVLANIR